MQVGTTLKYKLWTEWMDDYLDLAFRHIFCEFCDFRCFAREYSDLTSYLSSAQSIQCSLFGYAEWRCLKRLRMANCSRGKTIPCPFQMRHNFFFFLFAEPQKSKVMAVGARTPMHLQTFTKMFPWGAVLLYIRLPTMNTTAYKHTHTHRNQRNKRIGAELLLKKFYTKFFSYCVGNCSTGSTRSNEIFAVWRRK